MKYIITYVHQANPLIVSQYSFKVDWNNNAELHNIQVPFAYSTTRFILFYILNISTGFQYSPCHDQDGGEELDSSGDRSEDFGRFGTNFLAQTCFPLMLNFTLSTPLRITSIVAAE